ncbi:MAG TPA: IclR family transcriptional regulator [Microbacterium sp.]|uniref:IclR family transcriptional regulator n=1 Tax=Microbacterium sp. TaxID=51671 RepID=UPI002B5E3FE4|nr:IclR family transcriptional regulator [Microbacterium sp.]HWI30580.1 IclR family transcriptional regulator [Microbacterium sp.]
MTSLGRAMTVLDAIADAPSPMSLTQLSLRTGIARSTVHRLLDDLCAAQYVAPASRSGGYRLGPRIVSLSVTSYVDVVKTMRPSMIALARTVNENVDLAMLTGDDVIILEQIASAHRLQAVAELGKPFAVHASCIGKVLLAHRSEADIARVVSRPLARYTPNTITDPSALRRQLDEIRATGIAFDDEEHDVGISALAVAVERPDGLLQAVSIVAPTARFESHRQDFVSAIKRWRRQSLPVVGPVEVMADGLDAVAGGRYGAFRKPLSATA